MGTAAIELEGIAKAYGPTRALAGIDLSIEPGQIFGFLGPNGAGKTTAIRILLDLIRPTAGRARVLGHDCQAGSIAVRERVGYVPGELRLYEGMRGSEFLDYMASFRGEGDGGRYRRELLERLGVDETRRIRALSRGNKQKIGLVQALMHRPPVLILDEPTTGLDPLVQEEVGRILEETVDDGRTVFFSSHVLPEVERLAHAVAIIRQGRIVAVDDVARLKSRSAHILEVTFAATPPAGTFETAGVRELRRDGATVHLQVRDGMDAAVKAIARYEVLDLRTQQPSLEDIFLAYYASDGTHGDDGREESGPA